MKHNLEVSVSSNEHKYQSSNIVRANQPILQP